MLIVGSLGVSMLVVAAAQWFRSDRDEGLDDFDPDTFIPDSLPADPLDEELSADLEPATTRIGSR
jgi:hypothetical protein